MRIIRGILLYYVLVTFASAEEEFSNPNIVAGYAPGVSGIPYINEKNCDNDMLREHSYLSSASECARTCRQGDKPKTCYYKFVIERYPVNGKACDMCIPNASTQICANCQCVPGNGMQRMALTVNRMIPGPSIQVCLGDHIVVDVFNKIKESAVTIHWHGVFQKGSQYFDGVPLITQCEIMFQNTFRYQYPANNSGTHFWHAHTGLQKMDGIFGSLIIREPIETEPNIDYYDFDLTNHIIVINEWMHEQSTERYPGRNAGLVGQRPDSMLINGKGRFTDSDGKTTNTSLEIITVEANKRYRFRLVNSFCTVCPGLLTIENHNLTVIAADGQSLQPVVVTSIVSFPAERFDFVINTDQPPGVYWIQLRALDLCANEGVQQLALLQYLNKPTRPITEAPSYQNALPIGVVLNPTTGDCRFPQPDVICINQLKQADQNVRDNYIFKEKADVQLYLSSGIYSYTVEELFQPNKYLDFFVPVTGLTISGTINNITYDFPSSPPISQLDEIPEDQFCSSQDMPSKCTNSTCTCTNMEKIPLGSVVEVILVDQSRLQTLNHPFHLHGYAYYVLSMGQPLGPYTSTSNSSQQMSLEYMKQLEDSNQIVRNFVSPPGKDTIALPNNGYVIFRFLADNPGYWMFHCHLVYHQESGMAMLFKVGEQTDLPPIPDGFPTCGNYESKIFRHDHKQHIWWPTFKRQKKKFLRL